MQGFYFIKKIVFLKKILKIVLFWCYSWCSSCCTIELYHCLNGILLPFRNRVKTEKSEKAESNDGSKKFLETKKFGVLLVYCTVYNERIKTKHGDEKLCLE